MYRLYVTMKEQSPDQITADEIAIASGKKILDPGALSQFLQKLESTSTTIQRAFEKQVNAAAVSPFFCQFTIKLMFQRVLGIRKSSKKCWQSGSSPQTSRFIQSRTRSSETC
jgi:hypothetical protein